MKRIFILFLSLIAGATSFGQTITGGDMETWRTSSSGTTAPVSVQAPTGWYGLDSVIIGLGQSFGVLLGTTASDWHRNLFKESTNIHGGSTSAKVMTVIQDTLLLPGVLTTAQTHIGISFSPPGITGITFSGGNAVNVKPTTVSAWMQYFPGKDSTGATGIDSGMLNVQALAMIGGKDSVIGIGTIVIPPTSSWIQVTATINYPTDTIHAIDTMRISFTSSNRRGMDSSTLYVDDVTMTSIPNPIYSSVSVVSSDELLKVYPNPVSGTLYFEGSSNTEINVSLYSITGQVVTTKAITGNGQMDVSALPAGLYFYTASDNTVNSQQRGMVTVAR